MERPFDSRIRIVYETLEKTKENFIFNFNQNDKILVWIVGFSVTAISIIISNISDVSKNYCPFVLKSILLLLTLSIISGIIYRFSALFFLSRFQSTMFFLEGAFSKEKIMPSEVNNLENITDIHEIYQKIKSDFDEDYIDIIELYNKVHTEEEKKYYFNYLITEYERITKWAASEYEASDEYMKKTFMKAFGLSNKKISKIFDQNNDSKYLKLWSWICGISISICIITFISVIIILALNY